jgi:hypothetical protein
MPLPFDLNSLILGYTAPASSRVNPLTLERMQFEQGKRNDSFDQGMRQQHFKQSQDDREYGRSKELFEKWQDAVYSGDPDRIKLAADELKRLGYDVEYENGAAPDMETWQPELEGAEGEGGGEKPERMPPKGKGPAWLEQYMEKGYETSPDQGKGGGANKEIADFMAGQGEADAVPTPEDAPNVDGIDPNADGGFAKGFREGIPIDPNDDSPDAPAPFPVNADKAFVDEMLRRGDTQGGANNAVEQNANRIGAGGLQQFARLLGLNIDPGTLAQAESFLSRAAPAPGQGLNPLQPMAPPSAAPQDNESKFLAQMSGLMPWDAPQGGPGGKPGGRRYTVRDKSGKVVSDVNVDNLMEGRKGRVGEVFSKVVEGAADDAERRASEEAQSIAAQAIGAGFSQQQAVELGMRHYDKMMDPYRKAFVNDQKYKARAATFGGGGGGGGPAAPALGADGEMTTGEARRSNEEWDWVEKSGKLAGLNVTTIHKEKLLEKALQAAKSPEGLSQVEAKRAFIAALSGATVTDAEALEYGASVGLSEEIVRKWNQIVESGQQSPVFMQQLQSALQRGVDQSKAKRMQAARTAAQYALDVRRPESAARVARIWGFSLEELGLSAPDAPTGNQGRPSKKSAAELAE